MRVLPCGTGLVSAVVMAAALTGCGDGQPAGSSQMTLFDKYGGAPTVRKLVDDAVVGLLADPVTAPFFAGLGQPGNATPERLKGCLRLQFTAVLPEVRGPGLRYPLLEVDPSFNPMRDELGDFALGADGAMGVPSGPGLGIEIDPRRFAPFVVDHWSITA